MAHSEMANDVASTSRYMLSELEDARTLASYGIATQDTLEVVPGKIIIQMVDGRTISLDVSEVSFPVRYASIARGSCWEHLRYYRWASLHIAANSCPWTSCCNNELFTAAHPFNAPSSTE